MIPLKFVVTVESRLYGPFDDRAAAEAWGSDYVGRLSADGGGIVISWHVSPVQPAQAGESATAPEKRIEALEDLVVEELARIWNCWPGRGNGGQFDYERFESWKASMMSRFIGCSCRG